MNKTAFIVKRIAGIAVTAAAAQGLLFWISAGGRFVHLVGFLVLAVIGCWCFTGSMEEAK